MQERSDFKSFGDHPVPDEAAELACQAWLNLPERPPAYDMWRLLVPGSKLFKYATNNCDDDIADELRAWASNSPSFRHAGIRFLKRPLGTVEVQVRIGCKPSINFREIFERGTIWICIGSDNPAATDLMMRWESLHGIQLIRRDFPLTIEFDEGRRMVTPFVASCLTDDRKHGGQIIIGNQVIDFGDDETTETVLQTTDKYYYCCRAYETALRAAYDVTKVDHYRVHHYDESVRQLHDGYDEYEKTSQSKSEDSSNAWGDGFSGENPTGSNTRTTRNGKSVTTSTESRARHKEFIERRAVYMDGEPQIIERMDEIRELKPGWCHVRRGTKITKEYIKEVKTWACSGDARRVREEFLSKLKQSKYYVSPKLVSFSVPTYGHSKGGGTKKSSGESRHTRARQKTSSISSRRKQRHTADSRGSGNGRKSKG